MIHWRSLKADQKVEAVRSVWEPGFSARQIAAHLDGATRFAVIGLYHRYGDKLKDTPLPIALRAVGANRVPRGKTVSLAKGSSKPLQASPVRVGEAHLCGKPLMMLKAKECRWPVNNADRGEIHLFCALPADGVYCGHHARRAILSPKTGNALNNNRNRL